MTLVEQAADRQSKLLERCKGLECISVATIERWRLAFNVSRRTIYRDLSELRRAGIDLPRWEH